MDIASLAAFGVATQTAGQKQEFNAKVIKQAVESQTQAAQTLTQQATEQVKAAASAGVGRLDIVV